MLKIHHLRNATLIIETNDHAILIDPMLGNKGSLPPFAVFRHKAKKNPTVSLPQNSDELLKKVNYCLITHLHPDHIDNEGVKFLKARNIPVSCSNRDEKELKKRGLNVVQSLKYWNKQPFLKGTIEGIPAKHGYGFISKPMGDVMGYYLTLKEGKTIYITSDTIYTKDVARVLTEYKPDINVLPCGEARFDLFKHLIMTKKDILNFVKNSSGITIANHMESINHCSLTRHQLKALLKENNLLKKVIIPKDGDTISLENLL
ncbi:L-ascorbate metabolism protein UlaG, beta-lactamase superfamily [Tenacibaculum sp. MAR_2009_124]|uniref:MBL fold metallo-hydrolase n=1 Tax=Tenacibaculum sp. MAR_2009_124 TaxID=1250059 RepID=UPI00089A5240|nr:MBL fold metallo-hydrolase [Tenacibaculum sp. MAR_2009_124]SEC39053.1 L-ascorbate metabolism protein UlaG, beta-lactamase superfamily [Tenacibaculum sp. MAR_2009_124]